MVVAVYVSFCWISPLLPLALDSYRPATSALGWCVLYILISFPILRSIFHIFSRFQFITLKVYVRISIAKILIASNLFLAVNSVLFIAITRLKPMGQMFAIIRFLCSQWLLGYVYSQVYSLIYTNLKGQQFKEIQNLENQLEKDKTFCQFF